MRFCFFCVHCLCHTWHHSAWCHGGPVATPVSGCMSNSGAGQNGDIPKRWQPLRHFGDNFLTARRYVSAVYAVIVCVCVPPSVTSRCSTKTAKLRIMQTTLYDSPGSLVFWCQNVLRNSNGVTPNKHQIKVGVCYNRQFATNISLHLRNDSR